MYEVRVIGQHDLPEGYEWAMVEQGDKITALVKISAMGPRAVAEMWAAYRRLDRAHTPCRQRRGPDGPPLLRVV